MFSASECGVQQRDGTNSSPYLVAFVYSVWAPLAVKNEQNFLSIEKRGQADY